MRARQEIRCVPAQGRAWRLVQPRAGLSIRWAAARQLGCSYCQCLLRPAKALSLASSNYPSAGTHRSWRPQPKAGEEMLSEKPASMILLCTKRASPAPGLGFCTHCVGSLGVSLVPAPAQTKMRTSSMPAQHAGSQPGSRQDETVPAVPAWLMDVSSPRCVHPHAACSDAAGARSAGAGRCRLVRGLSSLGAHKQQQRSAEPWTRSPPCVTRPRPHVRCCSGHACVVHICRSTSCCRASSWEPCTRQTAPTYDEVPDRVQAVVRCCHHP